MSLMGWIALLFAAAALNQLYGLFQLRRYLAGAPRIWGAPALDEFNALVRVQMYLALLQIALLGGMGALGVIGVVTARLSGGEFGRGRRPIA